MEEIFKAALGIALLTEVMYLGPSVPGMLYRLLLGGMRSCFYILGFCVTLWKLIKPIGIHWAPAAILQAIAENELLHVGFIFVLFIAVAIGTAYGYKNL